METRSVSIPHLPRELWTNEIFPRLSLPSRFFLRYVSRFFLTALGQEVFFTNPLIECAEFGYWKIFKWNFSTRFPILMTHGVIHSALHGNDSHVIELLYSKYPKLFLEDDIASYCSDYGTSLDIIKLFVEKTGRLPGANTSAKRLCRYLAKESDNMKPREIDDFLKTYRIEQPRLKFALQVKNMRFIDYLIDKQAIDLLDGAIYTLFKSGDCTFARWFYSNYSHILVFPDPSTLSRSYNIAASKRSLDLMIFAKEIQIPLCGVPRDECVYTALEYGSYDCAEWLLREMAAPFDITKFESFWESHLSPSKTAFDSLKWALQRGVTLSQNIYNSAMRWKRNAGLLAWLEANNCPINRGFAFERAIRNCWNEKALQIYHQKRFPIITETPFKCALLSNNIEMMEWLFERTAPLPPKTLDIALNNTDELSVNTIRFLHEIAQIPLKFDGAIKFKEETPIIEIKRLLDYLLPLNVEISSFDIYFLLANRIKECNKPFLDYLIKWGFVLDFQVALNAIKDESTPMLKWTLKHSSPPIDLQELSRLIPNSSKSLKTFKWLCRHFHAYFHEY